MALTQEELDEYLAQGLGEAPSGGAAEAEPVPEMAAPEPEPRPVSPEQKSVLDDWLASQAETSDLGSTRTPSPDLGQTRAPSPAQGEKEALEQARPAEQPPAAKVDAQVPPAKARPLAAPAERPNLHPYGLETPPEVKRDRLGEVASTVLGIFAGKDKHARRAALAGGLTTMISSKPGEEVEKENYDRKFKAANASAHEQAAGLTADRLVNEQKYKDALMSKWATDARARDQGIDIRREGLGLRKTKQGIETDPEHPAVVALKEQLYQNGVTRGALDGQNLMTMRQNPAYKEQVELFYKQAGIPTAAAQAGATAAAGTQARINVETDPSNLERTVAAKAETTRATNEASAIGSQQGKLASGVIMNADELLKDAPYVKAKNPQALQSALSGPNATKVIAQLQGYGRSRDVVEKMDHLRQVFREAVSNGDAATAYNARQTYESHADEYAAAMGQLAGVHSQGTNEHFRSRVPSIANPVIQLDTLYEQIDANAQSNLGVYGLEPTRPGLSGSHMYPNATPPSQIHPKPRGKAPAKAAPKNLKPITVDDL